MRTFATAVYVSSRIRNRYVIDALSATNKTTRILHFLLNKTTNRSRKEVVKGDEST
jgi:hypothetical protein